MNTTRFVAFVVTSFFAAAAASAAESVSTPDPNSQAAVVVARIGDFEITKDDLARRLLQELRPREEQFYRPGDPVTAESVLRKMLAEKAESIEGRKLGYLQDEAIVQAVTQLEEGRIVSQLLESKLGDKLKDPNDAVIERLLKANPKATREQAKAYAQRMMAVQLMEQYYAQVCEKRGLKKMTENLAKAAEIYQRLLTHPREARGPNEYWIRSTQVTTDLSDEERGMVLATYEGGQFTLKDWFQALCNIAPPRRPKGLDTAQGVEKLLDMVLRRPILAAEARSFGFDKAPELRKAVKTLEDQRLQYKVQEIAVQDIKEPTPDEVKACFDNDPNRFATDPVLKAAQIWCADEETARKIKTQLDQGADFMTLMKDESLQKDVEVYSLRPGSEGPFWADLWKGEPNQVLGPMLGFYNSGVKWRLVKVQEKIPAQPQEFSEQLANGIKWWLYGERRQQALKDFEKRLLEKYPYEVYSDRIRDMDPLAIALKQPVK